MSRFQFSHKIHSFNSYSQDDFVVAQALCIHFLFLCCWLGKHIMFQNRLFFPFPESAIWFLLWCKSEFSLSYLGYIYLNENISPFNFFSVLKPRWCFLFKLKNWLLEYSIPIVGRISCPLYSFVAKGRHKTVLESASRDLVLQFILLFVSQKSSRVQSNDHWSQLALNCVINPNLMIDRV